MISFDDQADSYEARAGLPVAIARAVAGQIADGLADEGVVVDVGAGTGTIGRHLVAAGARYVALDASQAMLDVLAASLPTGARATLHVVDADAPWPLADRSAARILFSRSLHQLSIDHARREAQRIAAPLGRVYVGRVKKADDSVAERLRRQMQQLLREQGVQGRGGDRAGREFLSAWVAEGGRALPTWQSEPWTESRSVAASIAHWRDKEGLGGRTVEAGTKRAILDALSAWAERELGDVTVPHPVTRHYELQGAERGQ